MHRNGLYCQEFIDKSQYIYNWMKKQPTVGEESITDWLLFALSESLPALRYVKHFLDIKKLGKLMKAF